MNDENGKALDNLILERELCEALRVRPEIVAKWRQQGLPAVWLHRTHRAYWRGDVSKFLADKLTRGKYARTSEKVSGDGETSS